MRRRFIALSPRFRLGVLIPWEAMQKAITPRTRLIPVCHLYLTRQILPVRATVDYARSRGSKLLVDEAFGLSNMKADIQQLAICMPPHLVTAAAGGVRPASSTLRQSMSLHPPLCGHFIIARHGNAGAKEFTPAFDDPSMRKYEHRFS